MESQTNYTTEDDLVQDSQADYCDQYDYLPVQPPRSPGGPSFNVAVAAAHHHHHHHDTTDISSPLRGRSDPVVWTQDDDGDGDDGEEDVDEAYLSVEPGDYHVTHPEDLMLPTASVIDATTIELSQLAATTTTTVPTQGLLSTLPPNPCPTTLDEGRTPTDAVGLTINATLHDSLASSTKLSPVTRRRNSNKEGMKGSSGGSGSGEATYVLRIHEMLEFADRQGLHDVVSWRAHGRAFQIHDEERFMKDVLPLYFSAKMSSFRRWLRAWGFCRMTHGPDRGCWYHRYFVRGASRLCQDLSRQQMATAMVGWPPGPTVPNFDCTTTTTTTTTTTVDHVQSPEDRSPSTIGGSNQYSASNNGTNPRLLRGTILEDLRRLLDDAEVEGNTHVASWQPHGRAFKIHNKGLFEGIMPRYFRTSLLSNLGDTLRTWGFRRLRQDGPDKSCYYHRLFVRGHPGLCLHSPREEMRKAMADFPPPEGEPNLDKGPEMKACHPSSKPDSSQVPFFGHNMELRGNQSLSHSLPYYVDPISHGALVDDMREEGTGGSGKTYVMLLHDMLEDAEKEGNTHIVSWKPHGRAWAINDEKEFEHKIMPRYFKAQMKSFLRWCRAWGFVRMTEGKDRGAWFHRYFIRGVTSLCHSLSRPQMLKSMEDWLPAGQCPDFYNSWSGNVVPETARLEPIESPPSVSVKNPKRLRGTVPEDLRQMLAEAEIEGNTGIVAWSKHGRAFVVHDKVGFTEHIMPRYFKAAKFTYFSDAIRQWGFRRFRSGPDKGAFYHKFFLRGQPELTRHLTRIQMSESMAEFSPISGEPSLRDLPPMDLPPEEHIPMDDDDDNIEPPLDADTIIAAAEQTEDLPIENRPELPTHDAINNDDVQLDTSVEPFQMIGILQRALKRGRGGI